MKAVCWALSHSVGMLCSFPPYSLMNSSRVYAWPSVGSIRLSTPFARSRARLLSISSSLSPESTSFLFSPSTRRFFGPFGSMITFGGGGKGGADASSSSESRTLIGAYFRYNSKLSDVNCFCCRAVKSSRLPRMRFKMSLAVLPFRPSKNFLCAMMSNTGRTFTRPSLAARSALSNQRSLSFGFLGKTSSHSTDTNSSLTF
mmetsp:Transcript_36859/g.98171  ORF Transcript_36859/g.98171 Transcript_36859/m.98171 type:complete len:201 (-) Transcript_36859:225-827(-)